MKCVSEVQVGKREGRFKLPSKIFLTIVLLTPFCAAFCITLDFEHLQVFSSPQHWYKLYLLIHALFNILTFILYILSLSSFHRRVTDGMRQGSI